MANLTRTRQAVIIEPLRPEKFFVKTFNATSLYILSICEVCGSYQCPYCPFYSGSPSVQPSSIFILILLIVTLTWDRTLVRMSASTTSTNIQLWHIRERWDFQAQLIITYLYPVQQPKWSLNYVPKRKETISCNKSEQNFMKSWKSEKTRKMHLSSPMFNLFCIFVILYKDQFFEIFLQTHCILISSIVN